MIYTKSFDASNFDWTPGAREVVDKVMAAGKAAEFEQLLEMRFCSADDTASDLDIDEYVSGNGPHVLERVGLDVDGNPIEPKKKFKVFCRITGVVDKEVKADTPEEARAKVVDEFRDAPGYSLFYMDRDDVETLVPVAYDAGDGRTRDYGPSEEQRAELRNVLSGPRSGRS